MTRIVDGHVEVYFLQYDSHEGADIELSLGIEHYLLLAHSSGDVASLRAKILIEASRKRLQAGQRVLAAGV